MIGPTWLAVVLWVWAGGTSLVWCVSCLSVLPRALRIQRLGEHHPPDPSPWPTLSVVVPACNEGATIEAALATLLAQDYPNLQVVLVDDRSTDGTGAAVDRIAARDPRIVAIHIHDLPDGWLGKVHALHAGAARATGEWVLFTDADVHFLPGVLSRAVAVAVDRRLDHLAVLPDVIGPGFLDDVILFAFGAIFVRVTRALTVGEPKSDAFIGVGAFNLVRRAALDRSEGFPWIRMEVADDAGLGLVLQRAGAKAALLFGPDLLRVAWYPSIGAMARGLEKNMFGIFGHFRYGLFLFRLVAAWLLLAGPIAALLLPGVRHLWVAGALALGIYVLTGVALSRRIGKNPAAAFFAYLGEIVLSFFVLRSAWACLRRGGIEWRGTTYPIATLRTGQRVKV